MLHAEVKLNMVKSAVQLVHIGILWMRVAPFGIFIEPNFKNHIGWLLFFCICICICIWIVAWTRGSGNKDCQVGRKWKGKRNRTTNIYLGIFCLCASFKHAQSMCILNMTQNIVSHWFVYNGIKKTTSITTAPSLWSQCMRMWNGTKIERQKRKQKTAPQSNKSFLCIRSMSMPCISVMHFFVSTL